MSQVLHGVVCGGKIELIDGPELPDGQRVQVVVEAHPAPPDPAPARPMPEEGVIYTPASPELVELLEQIRRRRRPLPPSPTGPGRRSAAGSLADDPTWDEHLREVLEARKSGTYRDPSE